MRIKGGQEKKTHINTQSHVHTHSRKRLKKKLNKTGECNILIP